MAEVEIPPEEQIAQEISLTLKEIGIKVTPEKVVITVRGTSGDLSHKEWRVVKSFVDTIISEMRVAARR